MLMVKGVGTMSMCTLYIHGLSLIFEDLFFFGGWDSWLHSTSNRGRKTYGNAEGDDFDNAANMINTVGESHS